MRHRIAAGLLVMALAATAIPASAQDYKVLQRATLGGEGGWDLLTGGPRGPTACTSPVARG